VGYEPLHHKYRPQVFADLVGQDAIAATLTNAIESQRIAPAYLFTGPRGTGKTSSARILAKSLNCLRSDKPTPNPCGTCSVCVDIAQGNALDVIEIDAASNTGVDNIRELIERAQFAPVQCRFKVYCLDEVHMLSTAAFNALLKTLEEPPAQVVFVLATTDPQRVLATIISRCQRFDFRRIPLAPMVKHLTHIGEQESIPITPAAVELVAQLSQGGLRDAESLLDQLSLLAGEIAPEQIWELAGSVPERELLHLLQAIMAQQPGQVISQTQQLLNQGRDPLIVLQNLTGFYRDLLIAKTAPDRRDLVAITEATWAELCDVVQQIELTTLLAAQQHLRVCEPQVKNTTQPRLWLEVALLGLLPGSVPTPTPQPQPPVVLPAVAPIPAANPVASSPVPPAAPAPQPSSTDGQFTPSPPVSEPQQPSVSAAIPPVVQQESAPPITAPEPAPITAPEPSVSSPPPAESFDTQQVWQQMLTHLHPAGRALFKQHGMLLSFSGRQAQIGIPKGLVPIAQMKVPEVEAAFQAFLHRTVKVNLVINSAQPNEQVALQAAQVPSQVPTPLSSGSNLVEQDEQDGAATAPPTSVLPRASTLPPEAMPVQVNLEPAPPPVWETEDELTQTSKSFANFFGGTLVEDAPNLESAVMPEAPGS
jgi:DNA polymerase III subunit gamma/tau